MQITQIFISAFVLLVVALLFALFAHLRRLRKLHGYLDIRRDIAAVDRYLGGEMYRDREDLVLAGSLKRHRATVRFSYDDVTPALQLRVEVPGTFGFVILPKKSARQDGGERVLTENEAFDSAWTIRSYESTDTKLLVKDQAAFAHLRRLCCSGNTYVHLQNGALELSELTLPEDALGTHIITHLSSMNAIAERLSVMPGAWRMELDRVSRKRPTAIVALIVVLVIAVVAGIAKIATHESEKRLQEASSGYGGAPMGIPPAEASHIPKLKGWRLALDSDFDPDLVSWLNSAEISAQGRLEGDFRGNGPGDDHAYLLVNGDGTFRVVVLLNNEVRLDRIFPSVAVFARIPKALVRRFPIDAGGAPSGDADGILLVRKTSDVHSALILSFSRGVLSTAIPANYRTVSLQASPQ